MNIRHTLNRFFFNQRILAVQIVILFSTCLFAQKSNVDIEDNIRSSLDEFFSALSELNHTTTTESINTLFGGENYFCINGSVVTFTSFLNNYNSHYLKKRKINHEVIFRKGIVKVDKVENDQRWIVNGILRRNIEGSDFVKDTPVKFIVNWNGPDRYVSILEMTFIQDLDLLENRSVEQALADFTKYGKNKGKGKAVRLNLTKESSPHYLYGYEQYSTDPKWRRGNDTLQSVLLYVNLHDGLCDFQTTLRDNAFNDFIIDDLHQGDVITLIPSNESYEETNYVVEDSVIEKKYASIELKKKRMKLNGCVKDKKTLSPIKNVEVEIYAIKPYSESTNRLMRYETGVKKPFSISTTNENGKWGFRNCLSDYTYYICTNSPLGYNKESTKGLNIKPIDNKDSLTIYLSPVKLKGKILDGKKGIANARISYKSLYSKNDMCYTSSDGEFEVIGLADWQIEIAVNNYKTLILNMKNCNWRLYGLSERPIIIKMQKGNTLTKVYGEYDGYKDKVKFK